jgi:hypothetical protein
VAGELAAGLLLYATPGFLRALTLILAVLLGSLSLGLWTAPTGAAETLTESLRRRWLLALIVYAGASAVSAGWSVQGGLAGEAASRGIGLALLAALPLYACGALLGAMSATRTYRERRSFVGASAVAGATLGIALAGYVLVTVLVPVSIYAFCLVLLSGGALVHGSLIAAEGERRTLGTWASRYGPVAVHEWSWGRAGRERILTENGRVRGGEEPGGRPIRRWEVGAIELLHSLSIAREGAAAAEEAAGRDGQGSPPRTLTGLVLGAGSLTLPRRLLAASPEWRVEAVERNPQVLEAAERHFAPLESPGGLDVVLCEPLAGLAARAGPYDAIVVDGVAVAPHDPVPLLDGGVLLELRERLAGDGLLILGGVDGRTAPGPPVEALLSDALPVFPAAALYAPRPAQRAPARPGSSAEAPDLLMVFSTDREAAFPPSLGPLTLDSVERAELPQPADLGSLP